MEMSKLMLEVKNKGDGSVFSKKTEPSPLFARSNLDCFVATLLAMTRKFPAFLTFAIYNVILLLEKEGIGPKRQTLSNQRAQSRASAKAERQIAEVRDYFKRIVSGKFA